MKNPARVLSLSAALPLLLNACMDVPPLPRDVPRGDYGVAARHVTEVIKRNMSKSGVKGLSIALVDDQKVVWAAGFGWADEKGKVRATPETVYLAGSVTSLFTATAVMQLKEKGLLDIDRPLSEYIPELRVGSRFPDARPFTVRDLLTHHSGLPATRLKGAYTDRPEPPEALVRQMPETFLAYPPGDIYNYSDLGYSLLGVLVSRVGGIDFASYVESAILRPLGMQSSSLAPGEKIRGALAKPYKDGRPDAEKPVRDIAAVGLYTTVTDLARFMQASFSGGTPVLKPGSLSEMTRPQNAGIPLDLDLKVGLGWHLYDPGELSYAGRTAFKEGGTLHYQASFITLPEHKLGVIVLSNSAGSNALIQRACTDGLKLMLQAKTGLKPPAPPATPPDSKTPPPRHILESIAGNYATSFGNVRVAARSDRLDASISGYHARFVPIEGGGFRPQIMVMRVIPVRIKELDGISVDFRKIAGLDAMVAKIPGGRYLAGTKTTCAPIPAQWSGRLGKYSLTNRESDQLYIDKVDLSVEDGCLMMEFSLPAITKDRAKFILLPISGTQAVTAGHGRFMGETVNVVSNGGVETLNISGLVFRRQ